MMDIASLQAFIAVAKTGSFSSAAEDLFLTQPAVSKRIAGLEDELGARLFDRIGRRTDLTEAGRALLPRAERVVAELEDSRRAISNLADEVTGRLSIGTSHHIGLHRLPPILRAYTRGFPEVELDLHFMDSEAACQAVERGELELGIVTLPLEPAPVLEVVEIWPDPLDVVVGPEHPLAGSARVPIERLSDYPAILPARGTYTREVMERAFAPSGVNLRVGMSTNYLETIKMLVAVGLGWSILPRTMLDADL
ncbi:MAG: LysR family transcriptional regulator, partial [Gammaproteobacteria bacterium]